MKLYIHRLFLNMVLVFEYTNPIKKITVKEPKDRWEIN